MDSARARETDVRILPQGNGGILEWTLDALVSTGAKSCEGGQRVQRAREPIRAVHRAPMFEPRHAAEETRRAAREPSLVESRVLFASER